MAVADLIDEARRAGLVLRIDGGDLVVRGPRRLADLAKRLIVQKAAVIDEFDRQRLEAKRPPLVLELLSSADRGGDGSAAGRLIGCGFPPHPVPIVDPRVLATPFKVCPACGTGRVLPELSAIANGHCYACWSAGA